MDLLHSVFTRARGLTQQGGGFLKSTCTCVLHLLRSWLFLSWSEAMGVRAMQLLTVNALIVAFITRRASNKRAGQQLIEQLRQRAVKRRLNAAE